MFRRLFGGATGAAARVPLKTFLGARRGPVVVPAEDRAQDRGEVAEQGPVRVHDPVEADVDPTVAVRRQRPFAGAAEVADDLDLKVGRRVEDRDLGARLEGVRELALEVLSVVTPSPGGSSPATSM